MHGVKTKLMKSTAKAAPHFRNDCNATNRITCAPTNQESRDSERDAIEATKIWIIGEYEYSFHYARKKRPSAVFWTSPSE